jgi:hypothetical protein
MCPRLWLPAGLWVLPLPESLELAMLGSLAPVHWGIWPLLPPFPQPPHKDKTRASSSSAPLLMATSLSLPGLVTRELVLGLCGGARQGLALPLPLGPCRAAPALQTLNLKPHSVDRLSPFPFLSSALPQRPPRRIGDLLAGTPRPS